MFGCTVVAVNVSFVSSGVSSPHVTGVPMDSVHKITDTALTKETQSRGYNLWGRGCGEAEEKQAGENTQWGKKYFLRILED